MTVTVTIYGDIHCPWNTVAVHRLRRARDANGLDVVFDPRPWPLELVNGLGNPPRLVEPEKAVLGQFEPDLFSTFRGESWPSTLLPAFEAVAAARRAAGARAAEEVDYLLRVAFFRDSADVSLRAQIDKVVQEAAGKAPEPFDAGAVMALWDGGTPRADVLADYAASKALPIQGSPQVFWPDGSTTHNPGMTEHTWVRGIPRVHRSDPDEVERLLLRRTRTVGA